MKTIINITVNIDKKFGDVKISDTIKIPIDISKLFFIDSKIIRGIINNIY